MYIKQTRVKSVRRMLGSLLPDTRFRAVVAVAALPAGKLTSAGLPEDLQPGDTMLPAAVGTVTDYNANGRYVVRKDMPKEERYVTTVEWTWEESATDLSRLKFV